MSEDSTTKAWNRRAIEYRKPTTMSQLETENAKLRELVEEMLLYVVYPYVCLRPEVLVERARELGIEVDE